MTFYTFEELCVKYRMLIPLNDEYIQKNSYNDSDDLEFMINDIFFYLQKILMSIDLYLYRINFDKYFITDYYISDLYETDDISEIPENVYTIRRSKNYCNV